MQNKTTTVNFKSTEITALRKAIKGKQLYMHGTPAIMTAETTINNDFDEDLIDLNAAARKSVIAVQVRLDDEPEVYLAMYSMAEVRRQAKRGAFKIGKLTLKPFVV